MKLQTNWDILELTPDNHQERRDLVVHLRFMLGRSHGQHCAWYPFREKILVRDKLVMASLRIMYC